MTLLDVNAAKLKAERQIAKLEEALAARDQEREDMAAELVVLRKHNATFEDLAKRLQQQLQGKDSVISKLEAKV